MKRLSLVLFAMFVSGALLFGQEQGGTVRGVGTVNQMSATPDQNQRLTGQQPLSNNGGPAADEPDNTDRVNGRAYPIGTGTAEGPQAVQNALDPRSTQPASDAARLAAAKLAQSGAQRPDLDPSRSPEKAVTPSPGANAKTKASTGGQTNDKRKPK
jgi:hypothetical protein